jgi:hypothetical protein
MKAEELRLGNLVSNMNPRHNDSILTIESIGDNHEVNVFYRKYLLSELEPIPLTQEWLLKFGFTAKSIQHNFRIESDIDFQISSGQRVIQTNERSSFYLEGYGTKINYVHQLQNLYFALTGEELTLKP